MSELDPTFLIALIFLLIIVVPAFWCAVVLLVSYVSGWQRLSRVYAASVTPHGKVFSWQSGRVGAASYRNCLTVHVAPEGLFLSLPIFFKMGHKNLLIPWSAIHSQEAVRVLWHQAVRFQVGTPSEGRIQLPPYVLEAREA